MVVIADSSALVALATCGALDILTLIYADIRVPQAVFDEVAAPDTLYSLELHSEMLNLLVSSGHGH
jgi:predicted nucleic acid-binding protein